MKKYIFLLLNIILFSISFKVNASTCSNERVMELTSLANNVNADYDMYDVYLSDTEEDELTVQAFRIRIYNITNDLNVKVSSDRYRDLYYHFSDMSSDGILYVDSGYPDEITNYEIYVRSNDSNCQNEVLRTITVTVPMRNRFADTEECKNNREYYMCEEYTTSDFSNVSSSQFMEKVNEYVANKEKKEAENQRNLLKEFLNIIRRHKTMLIIFGIVLVLFIIISIIVIRVRRRLV